MADSRPANGPLQGVAFGLKEPFNARFGRFGPAKRP
jgi:hypothetical protein